MAVSQISLSSSPSVSLSCSQERESSSAGSLFSSESLHPPVSGLSPGREGDRDTSSQREGLGSCQGSLWTSHISTVSLSGETGITERRIETTCRSAHTLHFLDCHTSMSSPEGVVSCDIVGEEVERLEVGEGLELVRRKVPLGVVLVIFESRPDCLPQV